MRESLTRQKKAPDPHATEPGSAERSATPVAAGGRQALVDRSPRQLHQRQALASLTAAGTSPVLQGKFVYKKDEELRDISSRAAAGKLARELYGDEATPSQIAALVALATKGDHGTLNTHELLDKLDDPRLERFALKQIGRRLHTTRNVGASYPEARSRTHRHLAQEEQEAKTKAENKKKRKRSDDDSDTEAVEADPVGDFSYVDLHSILAAATQGMDPEQAKQAAQAAVDNFERMKLHVDVRMDADIQLMVQHALQYQAFNHPQLKGRRKQGPTDEEAGQNRFRQFELEKSKAMLVHDASHGFGRTLPPKPTEPDQPELAFSALMDVNRPLPQSTLDGATYKAVFLCTKQILELAYRALPENKAPSPENFFTQRLHLNNAFAQQMTQMDGTHLTTPDEATTYVQNTLGFPKFSTRGEESDDDQSDAEDYGTHSDASVMDVDENIFQNKPRMDLFTVSLATLSKVASQKQLIDEMDSARPARPGRKTAEERDRKHTKRRKLLKRRVEWANQQHGTDFHVTRLESDYLKRKKALIDKMETGLEMELDKTVDTDERQALEDKLTMLSDLQVNLDQFYTDTSVKSLREKRTASKRWKATKAHKPIFGPVGSEKSLTAYLDD
jgi:hypothetical protein